jgi:hypothetical protein
MEDDLMMEHKVFEYGRQIGLLQTQFLARKVETEVVCGEKQIICKFDKTPKKWVLEGEDRYEKLFHLFKMKLQDLEQG